VKPVVLPLGAQAWTDGTTSFCVWAPAAAALRLRPERPSGRPLEMQRSDDGYHTLIADVGAGSDYWYELDNGKRLPDPASRWQPHGVHGPSRVVPATFDWQIDAWPAPDLEHMVIYEIHVGTFAPEGTFDAAAARLRSLHELGITTIEIMPVAQFPGSRNWGYDGAFPFAVQHSYGGPDGLKRFVDAAHLLGMTVILDVVYNHLGPEGNYLPIFGPYFTDTYCTPWGAALNFDGAHSDHVRRFFIENALQWIDEYRIDALRLDAIHSIFDMTAEPFLRQLSTAVHDRAAELGRTALVIAESDLADPRILRSAERGGCALDAQWLDDFHHALRTLLTGESGGYYVDYGQLEHLARALRDSYVYTGQYSRFRQRQHGAVAPDIAARRFVVFAQNHDQIGNRMAGDRLATALTAAQQRLAAATVLLSPFTPLLFMGEEYGETRPFPYFVSHGDDDLVEAVRRGRRAEFDAFSWSEEPPDPQSEHTFRSAILDWAARDQPGHRELLALHRHLLTLRASEPAIRLGTTDDVSVVDVAGRSITGDTNEGIVVLRRSAPRQKAILLLNFAAGPARPSIDVPPGAWRTAVDTSHDDWGGPGSTVPATVQGGPDVTLALHGHAALLLLQDEGP
jgi:maltooligosyltrehalose trehalohydrolase